MPDPVKMRCCNVCKNDPESLKNHGRKCDGCGATTCRHVATSKGDDDRCPLCALRARKAEKAEATRKAIAKDKKEEAGGAGAEGKAAAS